MADELLENLKRRAFHELNRRDLVGPVLDLNYLQKQVFKAEDLDSIRPLLDKHLKRFRHLLWFMGLAVPLLLILDLYLEFSVWSAYAGEGSWGTAVAIIISALWTTFFVGAALRIAYRG